MDCYSTITTTTIATDENHHQIDNDRTEQQQQQTCIRNTAQSPHRDESITTTSDISYYDLVANNRDYRLFLLSYIITNLGHYLTYIATIDFIETELSKTGHSSQKTAISYLILLGDIPSVLFNFFGGTLADAQDRRTIMVTLNIAGAFGALLYVAAYQAESIVSIYCATFLQQCIAGAYQPSSTSIIPMLVKRGGDELKKATTLEGLCWSALSAFGAVLSGMVVNTFGIRAYYFIDGATYLVSASLLWLLKGDYNVLKGLETRHQKLHRDTRTPLLTTMFREGAEYLISSPFGAIVFFKISVALVYGACDVLIVAFSEEINDNNNTNNNDTTTTTISTEKDVNARLGFLFSLVGIGSLLGPLLTEPFITVERPTTLQFSCVFGFVLSAIGYGGWSLVGSPFWSVSIFGLVRAAGSSIIWINSTLLLQKLVSEQMLGRVLAIDYALGILMEAGSAYLCGILMDHAHWSAYQVSFLLAVLSLVFSLLWGGWYRIPSSSSSSHDHDHGGDGAAGKVDSASREDGNSPLPDEESYLISSKY